MPPLAPAAPVLPAAGAGAAAPVRPASQPRAAVSTLVSRPVLDRQPGGHVRLWSAAPPPPFTLDLDALDRALAALAAPAAPRRQSANPQRGQRRLQKREAAVAAAAAAAAAAFVPTTRLLRGAAPLRQLGRARAGLRGAPALAPTCPAAVSRLRAAAAAAPRYRHLHVDHL